MIKLRSLLPSRFKKQEKVFDKKDVVKSDTWTHATWSSELINSLLSGKPYITKKEDIKKFNVPIKKVHGRDQANIYSPNFKKGDIFQGYESNPYLITTDLDDEAFQPNWNGINYDDFNDSQRVGVLRPDYRDAKHFKLWRRVPVEDSNRKVVRYGYVPVTKPVKED